VLAHLGLVAGDVADGGVDLGERDAHARPLSVCAASQPGVHEVLQPRIRSVGRVDERGISLRRMPVPGDPNDACLAPIYAQRLAALGRTSSTAFGQLAPAATPGCSAARRRR
jgi:hypothetical protein